MRDAVPLQPEEVEQRSELEVLRAEPVPLAVPDGALQGVERRVQLHRQELPTILVEHPLQTVQVEPADVVSADAGDVVRIPGVAADERDVLELVEPRVEQPNDPCRTLCLRPGRRLVVVDLQSDGVASLLVELDLLVEDQELVPVLIDGDRRELDHGVFGLEPTGFEIEEHGSQRSLLLSASISETRTRSGICRSNLFASSLKMSQRRTRTNWSSTVRARRAPRRTSRRG